MPISELVVLADASPLVHLDRIGRLDLLPALYSQVALTATVAEEVGRGSRHHVGLALSSLPWVRVVPDLLDPVVVAIPRLDPGEISAISLARSVPHHLLIIDDLAGRAAAESLHLRFIGTVGVVLQAKRNGIIPVAAVVVDSLIAAQFRLSSSMRTDLLRTVGEA